MDLTDLLEYIKGKNYNCKEVLYVDTDVKEVFGLLKAKAKNTYFIFSFVYFGRLVN